MGCPVCRLHAPRPSACVLYVTATEAALCLTLCCPACRMHGKVHDTAVAGEAQVAKATINCPHLRYPMTGVGANISLQDDALQVGLPSLPQIQGRQGTTASLQPQGLRRAAVLCRAPVLLPS